MFLFLFLIGLTGFSTYTWLLSDGPKAKTIIDESEVPQGGLALKSVTNNVSILTPTHKHSLSFSSSNPSSIEASGSYKQLSLSADIPVDGKSENSLYGRSRNFDVSLIKPSFGLELFFHKNKGFRLKDDARSDPDPIWRVEQGYLKRDDMTVTSFGFNAFYVVIPEQFSPEAALSYTKRQTEWGWSPLLMVSQDAYDISSEHNLIPQSENEALSSANGFSGGLFTMTTFSAGWGVLVPVEHLFLNYDLMFGLGPELRRYSVGDRIVADTGTSEKAFMNISLGYSNELFASGLEAKFDSKWTFADGFDLHYENNVLRVFYLRRF